MEQKITKLPCVGKWFEVRPSADVMNSPGILQWLVDTQMKSHMVNKKNLAQTLINELTELFGAPNTTLRLEFPTKVWVLCHGKLKFNVFSSNRMGTNIEVCRMKFEDIRSGINHNEIISFLEELLKMINEPSKKI